MICRYILLITFLTSLRFFLVTVKWFQLLQFITIYSILHCSFVCTQLNDFNYCFVSLTILLNISHLLTQINYQTVLFQTTQFSIRHLFALRLNFKMFYLTNTLYLGTMANKGYSAFPEAPVLLEFSIKLFCVISRTLVGGESYPSAEMQSVYSTALPTGVFSKKTSKTHRALVKKQVQTHKLHSPVNLSSWTRQFRPIMKKLHPPCVDTGCRAEGDRDGWRKRDKGIRA